MADEKAAAPAASDKPMSFSEITASNVKLTADEDVDEPTEATETEGEDEDSEEIVDPDEVEGEDEETETEEEEDERDNTEPARRRKDEGEEEEIEDPDEDEEDSDEDEDDAEKEYTEMQKGKLKDDLKIEVKVDGRREEVTLKDLKESYSSRAHNTRESQRIQMEKEEIRKEVQKLDAAIGPAWKAVKGKNLEGALLHLAKLAGMNTLEVKRRLREEIAPAIQQYAKLTPEQRKQVDLEEELEYRRNQEKEREEESKRQSETQASLRSLHELQAKHGISDEELQYGTDWLQRNNQNLTRESLLNTVLTARAIDKSLEAIKLKKPSLEANEKFVDRVIRIAKANPRISVGGLARWVEQNAPKYMPKKEKETAELVKDMSRKALKKRAKTSLENPAKAAKKPMSFGDLP